MKTESPEETDGHWVTRLRSEARTCEFDKMNNDEAIKLVQTLHTHSTRLQKEIISKDLILTCALEYAQALELTDKEVTFRKNNSIAPENPVYNPWERGQPKLLLEETELKTVAPAGSKESVYIVEGIFHTKIFVLRSM